MGLVYGNSKKRMGDSSAQHRFLIGDGSRVSFWKDFWCEEEALCYLFPTLFNLTVHKEALVRDVRDNF